MAHDVFISYAPENKTLVDGVVNYLESNGIRCWFAPRDIRPGESRMVAIPTAIRESRVFILAFTGKANDSQNVSREVNLALESGAVVIPLRFEDVMPGDTLSYALSGVHWLDAMTEPMDVHLQQLTDQVFAHLQRERPDSQVRPVTVAPRPAPQQSPAAPVTPQFSPAPQVAPQHIRTAPLTPRPAPVTLPTQKEKSASVALVLAVTLGLFGAHRFYLGKTGTGIAQAATFGGFFIWTLVDIFNILRGEMTDANGRPLSRDRNWRALSSTSAAILTWWTSIWALMSKDFFLGTATTTPDPAIAVFALVLALGVGAMAAFSLREAFRGNAEKSGDSSTARSDSAEHDLAAV